MNFFRPALGALFALIFCARIAFGLTVKPNVAPVVANPISDKDVYLQNTRFVDLAGFFADPDATAAVKLVTSLGTMNFTLDGATAPITVANFLNYVDAGRYFKIDSTNGQSASDFFHRSVSNFVIQAGGFLGTVNPSSPTVIQPTAVLTFPAIQNEPVISNRRGTIAMAKLGGDPNSATSQWFINLADNSGGGPALDTQNGGFTVFGRVAGNGMTVADAIAALPKYNGGSPFDALPVRNYSSGSGVPKVANLVSIPEFTRTSPLIYSASSNNTAIVTTSVSGSNLLVRGLQLGSAQVTVTATDLDGATVSQNFNVNVVAASGRLLNIATRANFTSGDQVLIGGFIVNGGTSKRLLVRAIGPSLANQGVPNALSDPTLELRDGNQALVAQNNDWRDSPDKQLLIDTNLAPGSDKECALFATVPSNSGISTYTAVIRSGNNTPGVGLVEVFDLDNGPGSSILNLSTRGGVGTNADVLIAGFILGGDDSRRIVVRALGPSLTNQGVSGALPDPTIELRNKQGTVLATNNDWQTNPDAAEIQSYNLAPADAKESAVVVTLPAGEYTAVIAGNGAQPTGVALVEMFQVR